MQLFLGQKGNEVIGVSAYIAKKAKVQAKAENVSLSAILEMALEDYLALAAVRTIFDKRPAEQSESELKVSLVSRGGDEAQPADEKPDWAIALEQRVSQLEQRGQGRKGKRRR